MVIKIFEIQNFAIFLEMMPELLVKCIDFNN